MSNGNFALLLDDDSYTFEALRMALRKLGVESYRVPTCKAAEALIRQCEPAIVFVASSIDDGPWIKIVSFAEEIDVPLHVIVVAAFPDMKRYLSVIEQGAFDFITPPFEHEALSFVVRSAQLNVRLRKEGSQQTSGAKASHTGPVHRHAVSAH